MTSEGASNFGVGLAAVAGSVFFFGTCLVPVKRYRCGDGVLVQFMMGIGIFFVGFVVYAIKGFPTFYPWAMLGGSIWAIGNGVAIPLTGALGMALAMLIWNTTSCLTGWAVARFGLFGINPAPPRSDLLNYIGLVLLVIGGVMFILIRGERTRPKAKMTIDSVGSNVPNITTDEIHKPEKEITGIARITSKLNSNHFRILYVIVALVSGIFYGIRTAPVIYMQDHPEEFGNESLRDGLIFVFPFNVGIMLTCSVIFIMYSIVKRGRPLAPPRLMVPSIISGALWAVAMSLVFVSNDNLSQTIAYPIITVLPGAVAALWSVFYFREIKGVRNLSIMVVALCITLAGSALVALSKQFDI